MTKQNDGLYFGGIEVRPQLGEDPEHLIKRFTRKVRDEGLMQELRDRSSYVKPSVRRKMKSGRARFLKSLDEKREKSGRK